MKKMLAPAGIIIAISFAACKKDNNNNLSTTDRMFINEASQANNAEIDLANLAVTKATDSLVRSFAQTMITEHTAAQNDLKTIGSAVDYPVSDSIDSTHQALKTQLSALEGRHFDSAYIYNQAADHQRVLASFQTEIDNGQHSQIKGYANTYKPHIQMHLQTADSLSMQLFPR